jgi:hypothetical protein
MRHPVGMADAVADTLKRLGVDARVHQGEIWRVWPKVVGSQIARHAQPQGVWQGRLVVHVTDSVWLHHLSMMRRQILGAINAGYGGEPFRDLMLRIGAVSPQPEVPVPGSEVEAEVPPSDPAAADQVDALLAPLLDAPFHSALRRLLLRATRVSSHPPPSEGPR